MSSTLLEIEKKLFSANNPKTSKLWHKEVTSTGTSTLICDLSKGSQHQNAMYLN